MRVARRSKALLNGITSLNTRSAVPRHTEITNHLANKICKDLRYLALVRESILIERTSLKQPGDAVGDFVLDDVGGFRNVSSANRLRLAEARNHHTIHGYEPAQVR